MRHPTEAGDACEGCRALAEQVRTQREMLIEVLGRDGSGGTLWKTLNDHVDAYKARGARLGKMEDTLATLVQLRTRLNLIGVMAMVGLVAVVKAIADWLVGS